MKDKKTPLTTTAKLCLFLVGFTNFILGYGLYFLMYDIDREKAEYCRFGGKAQILALAAYFMARFIGSMIS